MNEKKKNFYRKKLRDQYKEEFKFLIGFICQDCIEEAARSIQRGIQIFNWFHLSRLHCFVDNFGCMKGY